MNIQKAFQRLSWRFSNGKFEPNQNDLEALKFLADWVNREKEREIQEQTLFAKMYVYCFYHELDFYKDISFAQNKLHEILQKPLNEQYSSFLKKLNDHELDLFMREHKLDKDWINTEKILEQKETITNTQKTLKQLVVGKWSLEQVTKSLNNQLTEAINKYKSLP